MLSFVLRSYIQESVEALCRNYIEVGWDPRTGYWFAGVLHSYNSASLALHNTVCFAAAAILSNYE